MEVFQFMEQDDGTVAHDAPHHAWIHLFGSSQVECLKTLVQSTAQLCSGVQLLLSINLWHSAAKKVISGFCGIQFFGCLGCFGYGNLFNCHVLEIWFQRFLQLPVLKHLWTVGRYSMTLLDPVVEPQVRQLMKNDDTLLVVLKDDAKSNTFFSDIIWFSYVCQWFNCQISMLPLVVNRQSSTHGALVWSQRCGNGLMVEVFGYPNWVDFCALCLVPCGLTWRL